MTVLGMNLVKRNLRVTKWLGTIPAVGTCTLCNREFSVPLTAMKRVAEAQESLSLQFTRHKCEGEPASGPEPGKHDSVFAQKVSRAFHFLCSGSGTRPSRRSCLSANKWLISLPFLAP